MDELAYLVLQYETLVKRINNSQYALFIHYFNATKNQKNVFMFRGSIPNPKLRVSNIKNSISNYKEQIKIDMDKFDKNSLLIIELSNLYIDQCN